MMLPCVSSTCKIPSLLLNAGAQPGNQMVYVLDGYLMLVKLLEAQLVVTLVLSIQQQSLKTY